MAGINLVDIEDDVMFTNTYLIFRGDILFHRDLNAITQFCKARNVSFRRADITFETGYPNNIYYFSDNLGGYTLDAIKADIQ